MPKSKSFTAARRGEYLDNIRAGMRPGAAAEALKFPRKQILDRVAEDENLAREVAEAEAEATEHVEEALYQAAVTGNVTACKLWLDLRRPQSTGLVTLAPEGDFASELAELNRIAAGSE